ncbi:MAG: VWA domain-containing protein [Pyrinomonadaceae bacterium]|nr:VWA domain-containing protein [Pyrinomonadaceae bacterium]
MGFSRRLPRNVVILLAAASLLSAPALAQTQTPPAPPLVKLNVTVLDRQNQPVTGLRQEDFQVVEGGKPQSVSFFSQEEAPLSYGLVIDASGSMRTQIGKVVLAAQNIIRGNKPEDETFIVSFVSSDNIVTLQELTGNKSQLLSALNLLRVEGGQTALIDAIYTSADYLDKHRRDNARNTLILVTDGEDRNSYYKQEQLFSKLRKTRVQIFIIGLIYKLENDNGGIARKSTREAAQSLLDRLAKETGGVAFYPKNDKALESAAGELMLSLRPQYVIGFVPTTPAKSGQYRKVEVTVTSPDDKNKRKVITQGGYVAP